MLKKKWLSLLIITFSVLSIITLAFSLYHHNNAEKPKVVQTNPVNNAEEFEGMKIRVPGPEKKGFWELNVAKMLNQDNIGKMAAIEGEYFVNQKPLYRVKAVKGEIFWESGALKFQGDVEFVSVDGKKLTAVSVLWDPRQKKIIARDRVTLTDQGVLVETLQLTADLEMEKIAFSGATRVKYQR